MPQTLSFFTESWEENKIGLKNNQLQFLDFKVGVLKSVEYML
jgi:hypothetical protein